MPVIPSPNMLLILTLLQENDPVSNRIEGFLSHLVALEEHFDSLPGDVAEQSRRSEVIQCVIALSVVFCTESLLGGSRISKGNCGFCWGNLIRNISQASSKICGKSCSLIRFVHGPRTFVDVNSENRWHDNWKSTSTGVN